MSFQFAETPNLRHLRFVQVIGRVGGVSGAARELCTSQPAVTQAVANLETEIGTPIFERSATGSYATAAGRQYLLRIDRFFEILDGVLTQVLSRTGAQADRLITGTQLRALIVITEPGRINEIAEQLGQSPASLQRAARTIERSLGRELFYRTAHGPIPNRTGMLLAREFRRAVREMSWVAVRCCWRQAPRALRSLSARCRWLGPSSWPKRRAASWRFTPQSRSD